MKQASEDPGQIAEQALNLDFFSDPVVFWGLFTVAFCTGMIIYLYRWVQKNMDEDAKSNE
jgi:hypothetical protein